MRRAGPGMGIRRRKRKQVGAGGKRPYLCAGVLRLPPGPLLIQGGRSVERSVKGSVEGVEEREAGERDREEDRVGDVLGR